MAEVAGVGTCGASLPCAAVPIAVAKTKAAATAPVEGVGTLLPDAGGGGGSWHVNLHGLELKDLIYNKIKVIVPYWGWLTH